MWVEHDGFGLSIIFIELRLLYREINKSIWDSINSIYLSVANFCKPLSHVAYICVYYTTLITWLVKAYYIWCLLKPLHSSLNQKALFCVECYRNYSLILQWFVSPCKVRWSGLQRWIRHSAPQQVQYCEVEVASHSRCFFFECCGQRWMIDCRRKHRVPLMCTSPALKDFGSTWLVSSVLMQYKHNT